MESNSADHQYFAVTLKCWRFYFDDIRQRLCERSDGVVRRQHFNDELCFEHAVDGNWDNFNLSSWRGRCASDESGSGVQRFESIERAGGWDDHGNGDGCSTFSGSVEFRAYRNEYRAPATDRTAGRVDRAVQPTAHTFQ